MLNITCSTCTNRLEEDVEFELREKMDDLYKLICPVCKTEIIYNSIEVEKIKIVDWLYENDRSLYREIMNKYFYRIFN